MRVDGLVSRVAPGVPCALVTVVRVEGSAPREVGASMLVTPTDVLGSVGGGRLEYAAIASARGMLAENATAPSVERHALGPGLGQCCGGAVTLWTAVLGGDAASSAWYRALARARRSGEAAALVTVVASAGEAAPCGARFVVTADGIEGPMLAPALACAVAAVARARLASGHAACVDVGVPGASLTVLVEPGSRRTHVVVFGAGHVGRALVPILATLPMSVTWVDSRADAFPERPPVGVGCLVVPEPEDEVDSAPPGASFVVLTHDHALDLRLAEAILRRGDHAYFGLIGSATKRARFVRRLRARGVAAERIESMRCPIGLPGVGGKSPGEIAVAIAAELLAWRNAAAWADAAATSGGA
jgi:xanthine dehydrogenase accessory factor